MSPLPKISAFLLYCSSIAWVYLYLYPIWEGCGFPLTQLGSDPPHPPVLFPFFQHDITREAPFRLLVLADPQLEGDTSLPNLEWSLAALRPNELLRTLQQTFKYLRKRLDLWGNDRYLAHIYRSLQTFTYPTHVTVLGDLLGSQWISDAEFDRRADRFWHTVFAGSDAVPEYLTRQPLKEVLGVDKAWKTRVIAIAGNHDVGYAGDMTEERIERFERRFGRSNWEGEFFLPATQDISQAASSGDKGSPPDKIDQARKQPSVRILVLNSMNLDTPALSSKLQDETYAALNGFISRSKSVQESNDVFTIVLTHVPLHKRSGVCIDGPYFAFHPNDQGGGVKEQNHLGEYTSRMLLDGIYGISKHSSGRKGVVLDGHDHEGCDVWHYLPAENGVDGQMEPQEHSWNSTAWQSHQQSESAQGANGIRELTMRAMMGEYGGNAAFLSAWFDPGAGVWDFAISKCAVGSQHIWWAVHVLFLVTAAIGSIALYEWQASSIKNRSQKRKKTLAEAKAAKKESLRRR